MHIPFVDLARSADHLRDELQNCASEVIASGYYVLGPKVKNFEAALSAYTGAKYCAGVGSGTDAITLALMAHGIGEGDEVITTNMTAYPTITGIKRSGATAITIDILGDSGLIDPALIASSISPRTRAIVPVHLYGQCCDMESIMAIARDNNIVVIEDCAQSIGASYAGQQAGSFGDAACFSFYPTKNLGCLGDGGAVVTSSKKIHEKILLLRNYGQTDRYHHDHNGLNSRLDELQAALLLAKLPHLDGCNSRRREIAGIYRDNLRHVEVLSQYDYGVPVYHLFVVKHANRDRLQEKLQQASIDTLIHYPLPVHRQTDFGAGPKLDSALGVSIDFSREILSLPVFPELTEQEQEYVIETVNSCS